LQSWSSSARATCGRTRGVLSDTELDAMLAVLDEEREQITAELRAAEDAAGK
jgi:uncharacterized small protein (DUF1192 family)